MCFYRSPGYISLLRDFRSKTNLSFFAVVINKNETHPTELWMERKVKSDCDVPLVPLFPTLQMHLFKAKYIHVMQRSV